MEKSYLQCPYSTKSKLATALAGSIYTEGPFGLIRFPFSVNQIKRNSQGNFNEKEKELVSSEIENLLKKVAIGKVCVKSQEEKQFLSNVFLSKKKDGSNRLSINLKKLNQFVPCNRLKIEILLSVKDILKKSNFTCKLDFKDAYFCIHSICESLLARQSFSIPLPLLWSGTSTLHISKFLKLSLAFVCQLGTLIITYLNNMLIIDRSVEEILVYRNKAILPIELGWFEFCWVFWLTQEKSVMIPTEICNEHK